MKRAKRTFTQDEKELVFNLWKQGTGFSDIGRVLDAAPGTVLLRCVKQVALNSTKPQVCSRYTTQALSAWTSNF